MTFSIVPEYSDMQSTLALVTEYGANLEYSDFWKPSGVDRRGIPY